MAAGAQVSPDLLPTWGRQRGRMTETLRHVTAESPRFASTVEQIDGVLQGMSGREVILDIGSGRGSSTLALARAFPDQVCVGIEAWRVGASRLVRDAQLTLLNNIVAVQHDVRTVLQSPALQASVTYVQMLYPDPWPKRKHHDRRLVSQSLAAALTPCCQPGAWWVSVTDDPTYAVHMEAVMTGSADWDLACVKHLDPGEAAALFDTAYARRAERFARSSHLVAASIGPRDLRRLPASLSWLADELRAND